MAQISIITASYNYENYIKETIESVINQTYSNWEMIIVDDGSKDNSVNVIHSYCEKDNRIRLYQHENGTNKGLIETLKLAIKNATGEWIVFLESDDTITPDYIEKKLEVHKLYPDTKFIYNDVNLFGDTEVIKEYDKYFSKLYKLLSKIKFPANVLKYFRHNNIVPTFSVVMLKKEILNGIDWDSEVPQLIDWYLWIQLARQHKFYYINEKLTNWRMHKNSYINNNTDSLKRKYFRKVTIPNIATNNRYHYFYSFIWNFKQKVFNIQAHEGEVTLFGKKYTKANSSDAMTK